MSKDFFPPRPEPRPTIYTYEDTHPQYAGILKVFFLNSARSVPVSPAMPKSGIIKPSSLDAFLPANWSVPAAAS